MYLSLWFVFKKKFCNLEAMLDNPERILQNGQLYDRPGIYFANISVFASSAFPYRSRSQHLRQKNPSLRQDLRVLSLKVRQENKYIFIPYIYTFSRCCISILWSILSKMFILPKEARRLNIFPNDFLSCLRVIFPPNRAGQNRQLGCPIVITTSGHRYTHVFCY